MKLISTFLGLGVIGILMGCTGTKLEDNGYQVNTQSEINDKKNIDTSILKDSVSIEMKKKEDLINEYLILTNNNEWEKALPIIKQIIEWNPNIQTSWFNQGV